MRECRYQWSEPARTDKMSPALPLAAKDSITIGFYSELGKVRFAGLLITNVSYRRLAMQRSSLNIYEGRERILDRVDDERLVETGLH